jgi:hypothetical protein
MMACSIVHHAWLCANSRRHRAFQRALTNPSSAQQRVLERIIKSNGHTAFGREHRFDSITSIADFQSRVPLRTYDELSPWIDRAARGEHRVLTRSKVHRLMPTSGSTNGRKLIPYTATLQRDFNAAIGPWICDLYGTRPELCGGRSYWSLSPAICVTPPEGCSVPIGFERDSSYLGSMLGKVVEQTMVVPRGVAKLDDTRHFRFVTALALLQASDLRLISIWHPSFLTLLLDEMTRRWEELVTNVRDKARARELSRMSPDDTAGIWPHLRIVSAWSDGQAASEVARLAVRFPHVELQAKGLIATEAFVTLPFQDRRPLAVTSHFFEFIADDGRVVTCEQLERGKCYRVVVTTSGGLYRYQLNDRVWVRGALGQTPSLDFAGRESAVDLRGEKLTDAFVTEVLKTILIDTPHGFAMLAPDNAENVPRYVLYLEAERADEALGGQLEGALCRNPHYAYCRSLGQLGAARVVTVGDNARSRFADRMSARGQRLGDIKFPALSPLNNWTNWLTIERQ